MGCRRCSEQLTFAQATGMQVKGSWWPAIQQAPSQLRLTTQARPLRMLPVLESLLFPH